MDALQRQAQSDRLVPTLFERLELQAAAERAAYCLRLFLEEERPTGVYTSFREEHLEFMVRLVSSAVGAAPSAFSSRRAECLRCVDEQRDYVADEERSAQRHSHHEDSVFFSIAAIQARKVLAVVDSTLDVASGLQAGKPQYDKFVEALNFADKIIVAEMVRACHTGVLLPRDELPWYTVACIHYQVPRLIGRSIRDRNKEEFERLVARASLTAQQSAELVKMISYLYGQRGVREWLGPRPIR